MNINVSINLVIAVCLVTISFFVSAGLGLHLDNPMFYIVSIGFVISFLIAMK